MPVLVNDFCDGPEPTSCYLLDPYILTQGVTFLHGKKGCGKSALTWEIARCVSQGISFMGYSTRAARVLYLENDLTQAIAWQRLNRMERPKGSWHLEFLKGTSSTLDNPGFAKRCEGLQYYVQPELVIWNTLWYFTGTRSVTETQTPPWAYKMMSELFPNAAHLVVHHDRKKPRDPKALFVSAEEHSGASGWYDLAQAAIHLSMRKEEKTHRKYMTLEHTGAQGSYEVPDLQLYLDDNGTLLTPRKDDKTKRVKDAWDAAPASLSYAQRAEHVAKELDMGISTVKGYVSRAKKEAAPAELIDEAQA